MQTSFVDLLRCLRCRQRLELTPFTDADGGREVVDGVLACRCQASYPVVGAIPRMLTGAYRMFPEFVNRYRSQLKLVSDEPLPAAGDFDRTQARTQRSFGYQWTTFSEIATDYRENFLTYLHPATPETFRGNLGLDVGCGFGRHLLQAADCGAEMVGMDFSAAIESSYQNTKHLPNVRLVQADIYNVPFEAGTFDFVYSIGVLHHLPDPKAGFRALLPLVRPGGAIFIWVYSKSRGITNFFLALVRTVTTRLPHPLVNALSFLGAAIDQYCFVLPYQILRHIPGLGKVVDRVMLPRIKVYSAYPFGVLHADWFDRLAAPIRFYYSEGEVERLAQNAGISDVKVTPTGLYGWRACGIRR